MAYNLKLSNGATLVTIGDGVSDTTYSSLTLFGKNFAGYGPLLNENQVHLLENFSKPAPPSNPIQGQLWWNSQAGRMNVRTTQDWKILGSPYSAPTPPPVNNLVGDQWWNTDTHQLSVFNGTGWSMIGPSYSVNQGISGPVVVDLPGEFDGLNHTVTKFYANGITTAILSNDNTFTTTAVPGFYSIKPGFTLSATGVHRYYGDADNAVSLGGVLAANYLRGDVASTSNFPLSIKNNSGLNVGTFNDLNISIQNNEIAFLPNITGRDISFYFKDSLDQHSIALRVDGATGQVHIYKDPTVDTGVANKHYVDTAIATTEATLLRANGSTPIAGNLSPVTNNLYSLGGSATRFNTVYSTVVDAVTATVDTGTFNSVIINDAPLLAKSAATKGYVDNGITTLSSQTAANIQSSTVALVDGAPSSLATLGKIATAINNDPNYNSTITTALATKATIISPAFQGVPTVPTPATNDVSATIANTLFVSNKVTAAITAAAAVPPTSTTAAIDTAISTLVANPVFTGKIIANDGVEVNGNITTNSNNEFDIGSQAHQFRDVYAATFKGISVQANYADLAEMYVADSDYEPGTVLDFGGAHEVTLGTPYSFAVAGIVSSNPAYLMNANCAGEFVVAVALQGRCPVKVYGPVRKGDMMVSAGGGFAIAKYHPELGTVVGKALQDFEGTSGVIEVAISRC